MTPTPDPPQTEAETLIARLREQVTIAASLIQAKQDQLTTALRERDEAIKGMYAQMRQAEAAEAEQDQITTLRAALKHCHRVLQDVDAIIDPEQYPEFQADIDAILVPCDEANHCPTVRAADRSPRDE